MSRKRNDNSYSEKYENEDMLVGLEDDSFDSEDDMNVGMYPPMDTSCCNGLHHVLTTL